LLVQVVRFLEGESYQFQTLELEGQFVPNHNI
jgi:hypothetical protein